MDRKLALRKPLLRVTAVYAAFVLLRFLLAMATSAYPMVNVDEFLYFGMARSMAGGQGLLFRGQPADYSYILYSLLLAPVCLTGASGMVLFRLLQLWNTLLVNLAVFPLWQLARRFTGEERAVRIAAFSMLLPDFMLGQLMMQENIILPLFFTLVLAAWAYNERHRRRDVLLTGVLGGLLLSAKPGAVVPAAVMLLGWLIQGLKEKDRRRCLQALEGLGMLAAVAGFFFLLVWLLGGRPSLLSIYAKQVAGDGHPEIFLRFLGVYPAYFAMACGIGCPALAFAVLRRQDRNRRFLFVALSVSLLLCIAGVAWSVNRYEAGATTAHMRYIGMYLPLALLFSLSPGVPTEDRPAPPQPGEPERLPRSALIAASVLTALAPLLLLLVGAYGGVAGQSVYAENMTFAAILQGSRLQIPAWAWAAAAALAGGVFLAVLWRRSPRAARITAAVLLGAAMLVNNVASYSLCARDTLPGYSRDGEALAAELGDDEPLYLYSRINTTAYYGALDVCSSRGIAFVPFNDYFNQLSQTGGVYLPFRPRALRGQAGDAEGKALLPTPATGTIVLDPMVYAVVKLSANTSHWAPGSGSLHLVRILDPSKPWLDSAIGGTENGVLAAGRRGVLLVLSSASLRSPLTLRLQVRCDRAAEIRFRTGHEEKTVSVAAGSSVCEVTFSRPEKACSVTADQDIRIRGYELINP